jgi:hypothetical protein
VENRARRNAAEDALLFGELVSGGSGFVVSNCDNPIYHASI